MKARIPKNPEELAKRTIEHRNEKRNARSEVQQSNQPEGENRKNRRQKDKNEKKEVNNAKKKFKEEYKRAFTESVTNNKERYKEIVDTHIKHIKKGKNKKEVIEAFAAEYQIEYDRDGVADLLRYYLEPEIKLAYEQWINDEFIKQFVKTENYTGVRELATQIKQKTKSPEFIKAECKALITSGDKSVAKRLKNVITESLSTYEPPIDVSFITEVTGYTKGYTDFWKDNLITDQKDYTSARFTSTQNYMNFEAIRQEIAGRRKCEKSEQETISKLIKEGITSIQSGSYKNNNHESKKSDEEKMKMACTKVAILMRRQNAIEKKQAKNMLENNGSRYSMSISD